MATPASFLFNASSHSTPPHIPEAGAAIISAFRPIIVLANIYTDSFIGSPDVLYNGVALD